MARWQTDSVRKVNETLLQLNILSARFSSFPYLRTYYINKEVHYFSVEEEPVFPLLTQEFKVRGPQKGGGIYIDRNSEMIHSWEVLLTRTLTNSSSSC